VEVEVPGVLIVEDEEDIQFLLRVIIDLTDDLEITGSATNASDALALWRELRPRVVLLDQRLPGRDGLSVASEILGEDPEQTILLFSAYLDANTIARADDLGITDCVSKDEITRLPEIIRRYGR
jgi:DNA-binding NarL/FixJ family response regulator